MSNMVICSTPPPTPMSMNPALIFEAMVAQASSPDEQSLLTEAHGTVSGIPERRDDILAGKTPAPG